MKSGRIVLATAGVGVAVVGALMAWQEHYIGTSAPERGLTRATESEVPSVAQAVATQVGERLVAHAPPEARPNGQPMSVDQMAVLFRVPGLVSIAGEPTPRHSMLTEEQEQRVRERVAERETIRADVFALRSEWTQARRQYRDRNAPRVGRRYGEHRDEVRALRQEYKTKRSALEHQAHERAVAARAEERVHARQ